MKDSVRANLLSGMLETVIKVLPPESAKAALTAFEGLYQWIDANALADPEVSDTSREDVLAEIARVEQLLQARIPR